jgi:hypothetical protein
MSAAPQRNRHAGGLRTAGFVELQGKISVTIFDATGAVVFTDNGTLTHRTDQPHCLLEGSAGGDAAWLVRDIRR